MEGTLLGLYRFTRYKPKRDDAKAIERLTIIERDRRQAKAMTEAVRRGRILAEAANAARDLVNEPGNTLTPTGWRGGPAFSPGRRASAARCSARLRSGGLGPAASWGWPGGARSLLG